MSEEGKRASFWERAADCKPLMAVSAVCGIVGMPLSVLSLSGVQLPGVLDALGRTSFVWLPVLMLATGFLIGWNSHGRKMAKDGITAERIAEIEAENEKLRGIADREQKEARKREDDMARRIKGLEPAARFIVAMCYYSGPFIEPASSGWTRVIEERNPGILAEMEGSVIETDLRGDMSMIWNLSDEARSAIDANPDLVESYTKEVGGVYCPLEIRLASVEGGKLDFDPRVFDYHVMGLMKEANL